MEDLSETLLLFRRGRSSSSLKLLSWLGSKSSSAAMLSIKRLTAPLEGCKKIDVRFYLRLSLDGFEIHMLMESCSCLRFLCDI